MTEKFHSRESAGGASRVLAAAALLCLIQFAAATAGFAVSQAQFPKPRKDNDRNAPKNLTGQVVDKSGKGIADAVVYLKDKKSLEIKTHISDSKGNYRFPGLDPNIDYEVHSEYQGSSSPKRTVSSFDERKDPYLVLEIAAAP